MHSWFGLLTCIRRWFEVWAIWVARRSSSLPAGTDRKLRHLPCRVMTGTRRRREPLLHGNEKRKCANPHHGTGQLPMSCLDPREVGPILLSAVRRRSMAGSINRAAACTISHRFGRFVIVVSVRVVFNDFQCQQLPVGVNRNDPGMAQDSIAYWPPGGREDVSRHVGLCSPHQECDITKGKRHRCSSIGVCSPAKLGGFRWQAPMS